MKTAAMNAAEKILVKEESTTTASDREAGIQERVIFRVGKKISKIIYLNGGRSQIRAKKCKQIASLIEQRIRKGCKGDADYRRKILRIVSFFDKRPYRVKKFILKYG